MKCSEVTFASGAIFGRGKSVLAGALVTSWCIRALASVANARILFAFIDVRATPAVHQKHVSSS